ncbi:MAG: response regulator [Cyanobacteriota bacterium]|nr:response regulator [Cyanobacteriota bacterium]
MIAQKSVSLRSIDYLLSLSPKHFSGRLDIATSEKHQWSIYFDKGRMDWAMGGVHPRRRLRRNLRKYCPNLSLDALILLEDVEDTRLYSLLTVLLQKKEISQAQVVAITKNTVTEVIFDLIQQQELENDEKNNVFYTCDRRDVLKEPIMRVSVYEVLEEVQKQWEAWRKGNLTNYSPNLAPRLKQPRKLQNRLSSKAYKKLNAATRARLTLRDLAVYLKQDLLKLTKYLMPYIHEGTIELVEVADLANSQKAKEKRLQKQKAIGDLLLLTQRGIDKTTSQKPPALGKSNLDSRPLIVCIDDCPLIQKMLKKIITKAGYRFFGIQQAFMALPTVIEKKPDLILLDLEMPIANGYEICTQIRRVSSLKDTPVAILTGRDGLIDRVRAKVAGCSDFIAKPVETGKVLRVIDKYLAAKKEKISN